MTVELVKRLVPRLACERVARLDGGWTSDTFEVDGAWIVQIERSAYAAATLRHQVRVLPRLAPHLDVSVPSPELVSDEPTSILYRKLPGQPCDEPPAGAWPEQLGRMLRRLHDVPPAQLGLEPVGAGALRERHRIAFDRIRGSVVPRLAPHEQPGPRR